jgi:ethanolamine ammonia-lyase large subunit
MYSCTLGNIVYTFKDLKTLLAKATPLRSGDQLAGVAAGTYKERVAAQQCLAELPLTYFLEDLVIPYESDDISRLIIDSHDKNCFSLINNLNVGELRNLLLSDQADNTFISTIRSGLTPEMIAAVSKIMRNQDLIIVSSKIEVVTKFRNTIGLKGRFSTRLQPNHPTDNLKGIAASIIDGLVYGVGDAVIGINPAKDDKKNTHAILNMLHEFIERFSIPTQSSVLCHLSTTLSLINDNAPVDLIFQSIGGTQKTNESFGISLSMLKEANDAGLSLQRGSVGNNFMYFETGQGSSLSANAHHGVDQQTCEARAYAVARHFNPMLVNSVVGFIGPEYLYDGKQITRAALEDHFCGKIMGLPMGMDVCYTNHAEADEDDMDNILVLMAASGCNFIMGVPGGDDIMLNYQTSSFHDALFVRKLMKLRPAPEFENWLLTNGWMDEKGEIHPTIPTQQFIKYLSV